MTNPSGIIMRIGNSLLGHLTKCKSLFYSIPFRLNIQTVLKLLRIFDILFKRL